MDKYNKKVLLAIAIPGVIILIIAGLLLKYYSGGMDIGDVVNRSETRIPEDPNGKSTAKDVGCGALEETEEIVYYTGTPAPVRYESFKGAEEFRGAIEQSIKQKGVNFAGKYHVAEWGCGTACQNLAVINAETGNIVAFGLLSSLGSEYTQDKSYLILNPLERIRQDEMFKQLDSEIYRIDAVNGKLKFQCREFAEPPENQICAQVLVQATNEATGETRTFPTPCDVPRNNWATKAPNVINE